MTESSYETTAEEACVPSAQTGEVGGLIERLEAAEVALSGPQRRMLEFLDIRDRAQPSNPTVSRRIGMLRMMQERGLVSRNLHGEWSIKAAGRAAILRATGVSS